MGSNQHAIKELKKGQRWLQQQVGKSPRQDDLDHVENLLNGTLRILDRSPSHAHYCAWITRKELDDALRQRQEKFTVKKWNRGFCKLIDLAISDLQALPEKFVPILFGDPPKKLSEAQLRQRREAIDKRWHKDAPYLATQSTRDTETAQKPPVFPGKHDPQNATFENPSESRNGPDTLSADSTETGFARPRPRGKSDVQRDKDS
jgi:hypothetical protein